MFVVSCWWVFSYLFYSQPPLLAVAHAQTLRIFARFLGCILVSWFEQICPFICKIFCSQFSAGDYSFLWWLQYRNYPILERPDLKCLFGETKIMFLNYFLF